MSVFEEYGAFKGNEYTLKRDNCQNGCASLPKGGLL